MDRPPTPKSMFSPQEQVQRDALKAANTKANQLYDAYMAETDPIKKEELLRQKMEAEAELQVATDAILTRPIK